MGRYASAAPARRLALCAPSIYVAANVWRAPSGIWYGRNGPSAAGARLRRAKRAPQARGVTERRRREGAPLVTYKQPRALSVDHFRGPGIFSLFFVSVPCEIKLAISSAFERTLI